MARQLYERFPVKKCFSDLTQLLSEAKPDVVHITTPPESHFGFAKFCLEWGCHVYVEKPFTIYEHEARKLIALANEKGSKSPRDMTINSAMSRDACAAWSRAAFLVTDRCTWTVISAMRSGDRVCGSATGRPKSLGSEAAGETVAEYYQPRHCQNRGVSEQRLA